MQRIVDTMPRDWDAATYDRVADPQLAWGLRVLDRMAPVGAERVLDAGCGSGRVTEQLLERLPNGLVVALDGSPSMIDQARRRLAPFGERVTYVVADLREPLPIDEPVDAILSTATFHWITDHDRLFANLAAVIRPGGTLTAQCGGRGNIASIRMALAALGESKDGNYYAGPEETGERLRAAGFVDVRCWLEPAPTTFEPDVFPVFLRTVVLGGILERMAPEDRDGFVDAVVQEVGRPEIDYVRLNVDAVRA